MMSASLLCLCAAFTGLFDLYAFPVKHPQAACFVAKYDADALADVFILDGEVVKVYPEAGAGKRQSIKLLPKTTAVDVTDLDGDGMAELVAVCGDRILSYSFRALKEAEKPADAMHELLRRRTQLAAPGEHPFPYVLVVEQENKKLLALPCDDTFELRTLSGELVQAHPIGLDAPHHVVYGNPFSITPITPPQLASPTGLEVQITRLSAFKPDLPPELSALQSSTAIFSQPFPAIPIATDQLDPDEWPWLPLQVLQKTREKVFYALTPPPEKNLLVRIARYQGESEPRLQVGPAHLYPGKPLWDRVDLPDFNGDGFLDLLLWNPKKLTPNVGKLSQAMLDEQWEMRLSVHCFDPVTGRFSATAQSYLDLKSPFSWYLDGDAKAPLRHVVLRDVDGDGRTDFCCSTSAKSYSVWRYTETGFSKTPGFYHEFSEPLTTVAFCAVLTEDKKTSIALRSKKTLFLLRAPLS